MTGSSKKRNKEIESIEKRKVKEENIEAEKEVEVLARNSRSREKETENQKREDRSRSARSPKSREKEAKKEDRSKSSIRPSHSNTDNTKTTCLKKPARSKSETRTKEVTHKSLSEAKDKLKKKSTDKDKTETGKKVVKVIGTTAEIMAESREFIDSLNTKFWDSDDSDEMGAVGGVTESDMFLGEITDLDEKFKSMELKDKKRQREKDDEEEEEEEISPRKAKTPEPQVIFETNAENSEEENDIEDIFEISHQLLSEVAEKDKIIEKQKNQIADTLSMIDERDEDMKMLTKKERENERALEKMKKEIADLKTALNDEKINTEVIMQQNEEEQENYKMKNAELLSKIKQAKEEMSNTKKENESLLCTIMSLRTDIRRGKEDKDKVENEKVKTIDTLKKEVDSLREEVKQQKRKVSEEFAASEAKYIKLKKELRDKKNRLKRSISRARSETSDMDEIYALEDDESSDNDENDNENDDNVELPTDRSRQRTPARSASLASTSSSFYKPHELKAMTDSFIVWPEYRTSFDHSNFVEKCERAAKKAIARGLPSQHVATNLNVYIEKKVPEVRSKYEVLRGDDPADPPLDKTLEFLRKSDPAGMDDGESMFKGTTQALGEQEESLMKRLIQRHDKHLIAASPMDRIRTIKKQFFRGLIYKPEGLEAALATCMDLETVADIARKMIEDTKGKNERGNTTEYAKMMRFPALKRYAGRHNTVAAVNEDEFEEIVRQHDLMASADEKRKEKKNERAATDKEFDETTIVCRKCRMINQHYTENCKNAPYCSVCKSEGHTDETHFRMEEEKRRANTASDQQQPQRHGQRNQYQNNQNRYQNNQTRYQNNQGGQSYNRNGYNQQRNRNEWRAPGNNRYHYNYDNRTNWRPEGGPDQSNQQPRAVNENQQNNTQNNTGQQTTDQQNRQA